MSVYDFGDARPVVRVHFDEDGWDWFRELCRSNLSATDTFLKDVEDADAYLRLTKDGDDE